jgi:MFS family permease
MVLLWGAYGMATVAVYTYAMGNVRKGREGTDFTIQIVITHLGSLIIAVGSGKLTHLVGYQHLFLIEGVIAFVLFLIVPLLYRDNNNSLKNIKS